MTPDLDPIRQAVADLAGIDDAVVMHPTVTVGQFRAALTHIETVERERAKEKEIYSYTIREHQKNCEIEVAKAYENCRSAVGRAYADRDRLQQDYDLLIDDYKQAQLQGTRLQQRVDTLEKRLEVDHAYRLIPDTQETERVEIPPGERDQFPDAVSCRDATIELMEDHIKKLQQRLAALEGSNEHP